MTTATTAFDILFQNFAPDVPPCARAVPSYASACFKSPWPGAGIVTSGAPTAPGAPGAPPTAPGAATAPPGSVSRSVSMHVSEAPAAAVAYIG